MGHIWVYIYIYMYAHIGFDVELGGPQSFVSSVGEPPLLIAFYTIAKQLRRKPHHDHMRMARKSHSYLMRALARKVVGPRTQEQRMGGAPELGK